MRELRCGAASCDNGRLSLLKCKMNLSEFLASQTMMLAIAVALFVALIVNEWVLAKRSGPRLGPNAAVRMINDGDVRVLDIRSAADYKRGHILNAENVPPNRHAEVQEQLLKNPTQPAIIVCAMGSTAGSFARKLRAGGHQAAYPLAGGLNAWEGAGMPLTTRTPSPKSKKRST